MTVTYLDAVRALSSWSASIGITITPWCRTAAASCSGMPGCMWVASYTGLDWCAGLLEILIPISCSLLPHPIDRHVPSSTLDSLQTMMRYGSFDGRVEDLPGRLRGPVFSTSTGVIHVDVSLFHKSIVHDCEDQISSNFEWRLPKPFLCAWRSRIFDFSFFFNTKIKN